MLLQKHKFNLLDKVTVENLKYQPIVSQVGTYTYNAAQVIANYLKPLCQNKYKITDTQSFLFMLREQSPLSLVEECVI